MLSLFKQFIQGKKIFHSQDKVLLAVSGGMDSVSLCELFYQAKFSFGIAHCNFQLRKEANEDEKFVRQLAKKYNVPFFSTAFDTQIVAKQERQSIQMAARALRYEWLEKIRQENHYQFIATAHHKNDSVETVLLNFVRGTGIAGLHGIRERKDFLIRPLLFSTRKEIESFVKGNKLKYREDKSNKSDKYIRNKIRHKVIPVLKEINPALEETMMQNIERIRDVEHIYEQFIKQNQTALLVQKGNKIILSIVKIKQLSPTPSFLFELLKKFNFNQTTVNEIITAIDKQSGKIFFSPTHRLLKDRTELIVEKITDYRVQNTSYAVQKGQTKLKTEELYLTMQLHPISNIKHQTSNKIAYLDAEKLHFPLGVRKWEKGDFFYPLGMKKKKKLSDFFIDTKISLSEKENLWLLTSDEQIAWIIGYRIDNRFKITDETKKIFQMELQTI